MGEEIVYDHAVNVRRFSVQLAMVLALGAAVRGAYVLAGPNHDLGWALTSLDGKYYLDWARSLAAGAAGPDGAFYLAPLYPYALAGFLRLFGDNLFLLYLLQHAAIVVVAGLLAVAARRLAGDRAGLAAAALALLLHPPLFFASRPAGESLAVLLTAAALILAGRERLTSTGLAGGLAALAALARPNLLLVPVFWAASEGLARRWRHVACLLGATVLILGPIAIRNLRVSGHLVPISSNAGLTLYHGNGPAATGGYTSPAGFSGKVETQRDEATGLARIRSGDASLDAVDADQYWGRQAIRERLSDPLGSLRLLAWRTLLLADSYEHGLDDPPALDPSPWRRLAPVRFGWILGLSAAAVLLLGWRRTGGRIVWGAVAACAASPLLFFTASRYRLPLEVVLCVPAGVGVSELLLAVREAPWARRTLLAGTAVAGFVLLSIAVPSGELAKSEEAGALANRVELETKAGHLDAALKTAQASVALDPSNLLARYNLGVVFQAQGRSAEAEDSFRAVLRLDAGHAAAAGNLANLLIAEQKPQEAVGVLRDALEKGAGNDVCWNNLVVALALSGDNDAARAAFDEAARRGVPLDRALFDAIGPH